MSTTNCKSCCVIVPVGPTGPAGPPGSTATLSPTYAFIYTNSTTTFPTTNEPIHFNINGIIAGNITHNTAVNNEQIIIGDGGNYEIIFYAEVLSNQLAFAPVDLAIYVNGVPTVSDYASFPNFGLIGESFTDAFANINGYSMLTLSPADVITIVFGQNTNGLYRLASNGSNISAAVVIKKLSL